MPSWLSGPLQVKKALLKSGKTLENDIVIVGVGARPNVELFKGQLDLLEEKPGGIKVHALALHFLCCTCFWGMAASLVVSAAE